MIVSDGLVWEVGQLAAVGALRPRDPGARAINYRTTLWFLRELVRSSSGSGEPGPRALSQPSRAHRSIHDGTSRRGELLLAYLRRLQGENRQYARMQLKWLGREMVARPGVLELSEPLVPNSALALPEPYLPDISGPMQPTPRMPNRLAHHVVEHVVSPSTSVWSTLPRVSGVPDVPVTRGSGLWSELRRYQAVRGRSLTSGVRVERVWEQHIQPAVELLRGARTPEGRPLIPLRPSDPDPDGWNQLQ